MTPLVVDGHFDPERFAERVESEARRLSAESWSRSEDNAAKAAFEQATRRALRAPLLAERSVHLRRLAKKVLPRAAVPGAKRLAAYFDTTSRALAGLLGKRGSGH